MKYLFFLFCLLAISSFSVAPVSKKSFNQTSCYVKDFDGNVETGIFTKTEIPPAYKRGSDAFLAFLLDNLSFKNIIAERKPSERFFSDTASVKLIISKNAIMSNLSITGTTGNTFTNELGKTIINSACYWQPGSFSGRFVNSWLQMKIYYTIDRTQKELSVKVGYHITNKWE